MRAFLVGLVLAMVAAEANAGVWSDFVSFLHKCEQLARPNMY